MFPDVSYLRQIADFTRMNDRALAEAERISRSVDLANARVARSVDLASVRALAEEARISRSVDLANARVARSVDLASVRALAEEARISRSVDLANARVARSVDLASVRVAEVARMVEPFRAVIASVSAWEASLTARIAELRKPWALPDHSDQSMMGFARLSRLSDAVHTAAPYSESVGELVASELGVGVEADSYDDTPTRRDENAVKGGLNPELIAFPEGAYREVVSAAGFKFRYPAIPIPQAVESADPSSAFDPMSWAVLTELEQRLRRIVEECLSGLFGPNWIKHRVNKEMRTRWLERQGEDRDAGRQVFDPIQYASFADLDEVIRRKDNWREAFEPIFRNKEDFLVSLRRLRPIRNAIAHSRPLSNSEVLYLVSEATRILSALKAPLVH